MILFYILIMLSSTMQFVPAVHSKEVVFNTNISTPFVTHIAAVAEIANNTEKINFLVSNITELWNILNTMKTETLDYETEIHLICGLKGQLDEEIRSKNWKKVVQIMQEHLNDKTKLYKQLEDLEGRSDLPVVAAGEGYTSIVRMLLCHRLPINEKYYDDHTLLHEAAWHGHYNTVKLLIMSGADVNVGDKDLSIPLHHAAVSDNLDVVKLLIQSGANVNRPNFFHNHPIHWATFQGKIRNIECLLQNGANINAVNDSHMTPLHSAAKNGQLAIVQLLLSKGCDTSITDYLGKTALDYAKENGHKEIKKFLKSAVS